MDDTVECARRVVVSVTPRLLCDSLMAVLVGHGLDVVAGDPGSTEHGQVAVVGPDTEVAPHVDVVVRLLTDVGGTPAAVIDLRPEGPSVRVEGMTAIISTVVDLSTGTGQGRVDQR